MKNTIKSTTVKSVLERQELPTCSTLLSSGLSEEIIRGLTSSETTKKAVKIPAHWAESFHTSIINQATLIHKKSLLSPANFIIGSGVGLKLLKKLDRFKHCLNINEGNIDAGIIFDDALQVGTYNNRFTVFDSSAIPENKLLLGLAGRGLEIQITKTNPPKVNIVKTDHPYLQIGQVAHWAYIEICRY